MTLIAIETLAKNFKIRGARHLVDIDLLKELAVAIEDGVSPNQDINLSYLFVNFAYGQTMETFFYSPCLKGSYF